MLIILFLPVILIDILIIKLVGGYYSGLLSLLFFLLVFYICSLLISIVVDSLMKIINEFYKVKITDELSAIVDFLFSVAVILLLDSLFESINLPNTVKILIILVHSIMLYAINKLTAKSNSDRDSTAHDETIDPSIEQEIRLTLQSENVADCIGIINDRHPDIPKVKIIQAVRRIKNE